MPRTPILVLAAVMLAGSVPAVSEAPFGGQADRQFATDLWSAMGDYTQWPMQSDVYPGTSPHGAFLRMYYNLVHVQGEPYHVIVKDNYGGPDASEQAVPLDPARYLEAVTIMVQREAGYDPQNGDWFWVKYQPDGAIAENDEGTALAGRVAKGASQGCIACHGNAGGGDYLFSNDER